MRLKAIWQRQKLRESSEIARQQFDINNEVNCNNVGTIKFAKHAISYGNKLQI